MDKYIYNEKNGLWYELQGDYYIPCLELPAEKKNDISAYGDIDIFGIFGSIKGTLRRFADKRQAAILPC